MMALLACCLTMKPAGPTFGHAEIDYRLRQIFDRSYAEFLKADAECTALRTAFEANKDDFSLVNPMIAAGERHRESGVLVLLTAGAYLEQIINNYAVTFLDAEEYEKRLARKGPVERWTRLPTVCQRKEVAEDNPAIEALRAFVAARNAVVHPKRHVMGEDPISAIEQSNTEGEAFICACQTAATTVANLIAILEAPPPQYR
jgi:hypothetical protein